MEAYSSPKADGISVACMGLSWADCDSILTAFLRAIGKDISDCALTVSHTRRLNRGLHDANWARTGLTSCPLDGNSSNPCRIVVVA